MFSRIGILTAPLTPPLLITLQEVIAVAEAHGAKVSLSNEFSLSPLMGNYSLQDKDSLVQNIDLLIAIGGDGTLLRAARLVANHKTPVLGVNCGRLGFLADVPNDNVPRVLGKILEGKFRTEERILLNAKVFRGKQIIQEASAFNEVVLYSGDIARMIEFTLSVDGQLVYQPRADGLIIATPTGSTAYALSAGGPIIHPALAVILLVPICAHQLATRPLVVPATSTLTLTPCADSIAPKITWDSQIHLTLEPTDTIEITMFQEKLTLMHSCEQDYFSVLRGKLGWSRQRV